MVGYNFNVMFEDQVRTLLKRQTVRADRKRHARPGEPVKLFCDQRSRHCRKLVDPDPICNSVHRIEITISILIDDALAGISIDGIPLDRDDIEAFARADGFAVEHVGDIRFKRTGWRGSARANMGLFWLDRHGAGLFEGVLVKWEPRA